MKGFEAIHLCKGRDLAGRTRIDCIVIVGSTCAGKTTLVNAVRNSRLVRHGQVAVPTRYVTRPPRANDSAIENKHVTRAEFEARVRGGQIALRWDREMDSGRRVHYGFSRAPARTLPVYSANNAVYANPSSVWPVGAFDHALLIGIHAPDHDRERRLRARSPDLIAEHGAEVAIRLADRSINILPHVDVVIDNHGRLEPVALVEMVRLVELVANGLGASSS